MPCTSFPITRALKSHIDPSVEPYTVLVPFRTDIWTHPKRDAIATPQRSPKTRVTNRAGDVDEAVKRVRSLMGSSAVPFYDNEKEEELGNGMDVEEKEEGVMGTCFGSCLGLRGGDTRAEEGGGGGNQYVVVGGGDSDGSGDKNEKAEDVEMLIEGNEDRGAERLRRVDRMSDLRGMNKRYDPDAESVYSQSTGTLIEVPSPIKTLFKLAIRRAREFERHLCRPSLKTDNQPLPKTPVSAFAPPPIAIAAFSEAHVAFQSSHLLRSSLTTSTATKENDTRPPGSRTFSATKRFGGESTPAGKTSLNGIAPLTTTNVAPPTTGASSAFGLGSGAFASFGLSAKTPKTPISAADTPNPSAAGNKEREKDPTRELSGDTNIRPKASISSLDSKASGPTTAGEHPLRYTWIVWYRPPTSKFQDYEKSTIPLAHFSSVESFWAVYTHLRRPSSLPSVSDYHLFRKGIRPVWEDEENKRGGKWIVRLKKGVADRYWEDLLLAIVGDQFAEAGEEVCGAVLSVRTGEDVLSVWTRIDGGRNIKIR
ncbi:MAG: hypothetical protein L6R39_006753 [Caloplaca ligustica]|nr:MAG: hypothetical protein L6R39_006753 [Caloplaca ligustica]